MNELTIYNNPDFGGVRAMEIGGEPWFVGKDVATALGYSNPRDALSKHVDEEDKNTVANRDGTSGNPNMTIINESGLYSLILSSKLPTAKAFKRWVTSEVIPSIRKHGGYTVKGRQPDPSADKRATAMLLNAKARVAHQMKALWDEAGIGAQYQALALNNFYEGMEVPRIAFKSSATAMYDATAIAKRLGVLSQESGKPHKQAVSAIIGKLSLEEGESAETPFHNGNHDGVSMQYAESVIGKVADWLQKNHYPANIPGNGKEFHVRYRAGERSDNP